MPIEEKEIIPRILRDMNEGVLVLDTKGVILYLNDKGRILLGKKENPEGEKYSLAFLSDEIDDTNDGFHQFVLDDVYDKENIHSGTAALVAGKVVLLRIMPGFFPEGAPFWDWSVGTPADVFYPATVILQEFLARGVMQENLNRVFTGKYAAILSIVVSSLVFGVLHIHYGFTFMLAAAALLGALGMLYHRQGNIWGFVLSITYWESGSA